MFSYCGFVISPSSALGTRGFSGTPLSQRIPTATNGHAFTTTMVSSKAVPFLEAPPKLDGKMVGDVGFDPLFLSNYLNLNYAREGELKNGRVAMLATLGFIVQELFQLPGGAAFSEKNPLKAIYAVPVEGWFQILLLISIIELVTFKKTFQNVEQGTLGEYGFDPLGYAKGKDFEVLKLQELKNGRLAMLAIIGFIVQTIVFKKPIISQLTNFSSPY